MAVTAIDYQDRQPGDRVIVYLHKPGPALDGWTQLSAAGDPFLAVSRSVPVDDPDISEIWPGLVRVDHPRDFWRDEKAIVVFAFAGVSAIAVNSGSLRA